MKKLHIIFVLLVGIILLLGACSSNESASNEASTNSSDKSGGELIFGLAGDPGTMEAYTQNGTHGRTVKLAIFRGLYNYNANGELEPELAESYTSNDDLTSFTFKLRNAKFHNGDPVTAEDVKYTFERILASDSTATFKSSFAIIDNIKVDDDKTVTFNLKEPSNSFIHNVALPESVIVSKSYTEENKDKVATEPMGAGPYKLVSWNQGSNIVVEKFDDYYKKDKPYLDKITFQFYSDENTRVNALRAGDVDIIETVPWKDAESLESTPGLKLSSTNGPFMALQFNANSEPFKNPLVKQAIGYAIDRQAIINTAFSGRGEALYGMPVHEGDSGYSEEVANYFEHNIQKAKELLKEAGYPNGFSVKLLATSQFGMHEQTAIAIQSELKKIGIKVELALPDWATRGTMELKGDYDFLVVGSAGDIKDPDWLSPWFRKGNPSNYYNEEMQQLLDKGRKETDSIEREKIYNNLYTKILEESPYVYLTLREQNYGMKENIDGFTNIEGFLSFQSGYTLEDTYIKK